MHRYTKILLWITVFAVISAVLLIILTSIFIDSHLITKKLQQEFSQKTGGKVTFKDVTFSLLPTPHVIIHQASLNMAGKAEGSIKSLYLYPSLLNLLKGKGPIATIPIIVPDETREIILN